MSKNDKNCKEKRFYVPIPVGNGASLPSNVKAEDIVIHYVNGKKQRVYLVPVNEAVYNVMVREPEAEKKKRQRQLRKAEMEGEEYAPPLSLNSLADELGFDAEDESNCIETATLVILVKDAMDIIRKKKPILAKTLDLFSRGYTEGEIGELLNPVKKLVRGSVRNYKDQGIKMLKELLED